MKRALTLAITGLLSAAAQAQTCDYEVAGIKIGDTKAAALEQLTNVNEHTGSKLPPGYTYVTGKSQAGLGVEVGITAGGEVHNLKLHGLVPLAEVEAIRAQACEKYPLPAGACKNTPIDINADRLFEAAVERTVESPDCQFSVTLTDHQGTGVIGMLGLEAGFTREASQRVEKAKLFAQNNAQRAASKAYFE